MAQKNQHGSSGRGPDTKTPATRSVLRRPTLPHSCACSTIGLESVRNETGGAIAANNTKQKALTRRNAR